MKNDEETRSKRKVKKKPRKKKKSRRKGCLIGCLIFFLILAVIGAVFAFFVYRNVQNTSDQIYSGIEEEQETHQSRENNSVDVSSGDPFSILLMGVDTGAEGRTEQGRADTMMVMTVNPNINQTSIASIPRDAYVEIPGVGMDKINHSYAFGGTSLAVNTVQNLFNIPIDYYVSVNMEGLQQIVDALGGITITPSMSFTSGGYSFTEGQPTQMDGNMALSYVRMRYEDPEGDYGRQARQRQVVQGIISSIASIDSVFNYQDVLSVLGNNMQTNMAFGDMVDVFTNYRSAISNMEQIQMSGSGTMMNGVYYDIIPDNELNRVESIMHEQLELND